MLSKLTTIYTEREAKNICSIYFEDVFECTNLYSKRPFSNTDILKIEEDTENLLAGTHIQHVTGKTIFYGFDFKVNPSVLIPRAETEELVYWMVKTLKDKEDLRIMDIGTGSGCIPVSLKKLLPISKVASMDISQDAIEIAKENATYNKVEVQFYKNDILENRSWDKFIDFNVLVSNPPYVTENELSKKELAALESEPKEALFVPLNDPLLFYKKILEFGFKNPTTEYIFFEISEFRKEELEAYLLDLNYSFDYEFRKDMQGKSRMLKISK